MLKLWFILILVKFPIGVKLFGYDAPINIILMLLIGGFYLLRCGVINYSALKIILVGLIFSCYSILLASLNCSYGIEKIFSTLPIFLLITFISYQVGIKATNYDWIYLNNAALAVIIFSLFGLSLEFIFPNYFPELSGYRSEGKYTGFYQEPSHLAFSIFPAIAILLGSDRKRSKYFAWIASILLLYFSRTTTFILLLVNFITYKCILDKKFKQLLFFLSVFIALIFIGYIINYDYYIFPIYDRVSSLFINDNSTLQNLSSLVYLQGWEDGVNNLIRSNGLGVGFNMMGCFPFQESTARVKIISIYGIRGLNDQDGSFLASKIISEFGIFGVFFLLYLILTIFKINSFNRTLQNKQNHIDCQNLASRKMLSILLFSSVLIMFTRSAGYFASPFFLVITCLGAISHVKNRLRH